MSKVITILCAVVFVTALVVMGLNGYMINRDINAWQKRAESVSSPDQMLKYMQNVKAGMESWDMTSGHAALLFPTAENDMGQIYLAVQDHIQNLQLAETMDPSSPQEQSMIIRLQDSIGDLQIPANYYWEVHQGLIWSVLLLISLIIGCVAACFWAMDN